MREIRPYGSEGGGAQANGLSLPLSQRALPGHGVHSLPLRARPVGAPRASQP